MSRLNRWLFARGMTVPSKDTALTAGPALQPMRPHGACRFALAFAAAVALHAGVFFSAIALQPRVFGEDGTRFAAIEVTVLVGEALESAAVGTFSPSAANEVVTSATEGDGLVSIAGTIAAPAVVSAIPERPGASVPTSDIVIATLPALRMPTEPPIIQMPLPVISAPEQPTVTAGGARSRSMDTASVSDAAAGAPPGVINGFRSAVGSALRKTKPPQGRGRGGAAQVVFTIGGSGAVEWAEVKASSGDDAQDRMAIAAVRVTRFPVPDPLLSLAQRTFPVTYQFVAAAGPPSARPGGR